MVMNCPGYSKEYDPTLMFRRILVPIDFSPESRHALITACETRARFGSEIHLFVAPDSAHEPGMRGVGVPWGRDDAVHDAEQMLQYFAESICAGMPCLINHATFGKDLVKGIGEAAKSCGATMVMLGTHDRHSLMRTRTERILNALDIPVLVVKDSAPAHTEHAAAAPGAAGKA